MLPEDVYWLVIGNTFACPLDGECASAPSTRHVFSALAKSDPPERGGDRPTQRKSHRFRCYGIRFWTRLQV